MVDELNGKKRKGTKTSSFGSSKREGHDSSAFYKRKLYSIQKSENNDFAENDLPDEIINKVICLDSRNMSIIPDSSVHLMVTSPPYNVGKAYDQDMSLVDYLELLKQVFSETYKKLVNGGRACVNVANLGRSPYVPLHSYIIQDMLKIGFQMRGEIIWDKGAGAGVSTAWGSFKSAKNPILRDVHEYILIFSKNSFRRENHGREDTINKEEFLSLTKSIWRFSPESAKRVNHPAPFPIDLPYNLIQLYTFKGDTVLDPFCGSGTTCLAALKSGRRYIGLDVDSQYVANANERIAAYREKLESERSQLSLQFNGGA